MRNELVWGGVIALALTLACQSSEFTPRSGSSTGGSAGAAGADAGGSGGTGVGENGTECTTPGDCKSGFCVDAICCNSACNGTCSSCAQPSTMGSCTPYAKGSDPEKECGAGECAGACDGATACEFPGVDVPCGSASCTAGSASASFCDGAGTCKETATDCAPYVCGDNACKTECATKADCAADNDCNNKICEAAAWVSVAGCASWITQGSDGEVYIAGCESAADKSLSQRTGGSWTPIAGAGVQISRYDAGSMWLRKADGTLYQWTGTAWSSAIQYTGANACASYIAAGASSAVYALSCGTGSDKGVYKYQGGSWTHEPGGAVQVAVTTGGVPYVVSSANLAWFWNGGDWSALPGTTDQLSTGVSANYASLGIANNAIHEFKGSAWVNKKASTPNAPTKQFTGNGDSGTWAINESGEIFTVP